MNWHNTPLFSELAQRGNYIAEAVYLRPLDCRSEGVVRLFIRSLDMKFRHMVRQYTEQEILAMCDATLPAGQHYANEFSQATIEACIMWHAEMAWPSN